MGEDYYKLGIKNYRFIVTGPDGQRVKDTPSFTFDEKAGAELFAHIMNVAYLNGFLHGTEEAERIVGR